MWTLENYENHRMDGTHSESRIPGEPHRAQTHYEAGDKAEKFRQRSLSAMPYTRENEVGFP